MRELKTTIKGEPSWVIATEQVELALTERGGHMAPVQFFRDSDHPVQPYWFSPWQGTGISTGEPVLDPARGDFFCMPFGSENAYRGEAHPAHGEPAGSRWELLSLEESGGVTEMRLGLTTTIRRGRITKRVALAAAENTLYLEHLLEGYQGRMCLGHHANLAVPEEPDSLRVSVSPLRLARVAPREALTNVGKEYYFLEPGRTFTRLDRVPTIWKDRPYADLSTHPIFPGFMDVAAVYPAPGRWPAWTAVVIPASGSLWFSLRDPLVLPQTTMWMSNGGRHQAPWNSANRVLGLEDGCAYFASGLTRSAARNDLNAAGIPTVLTLRPDRPTRIRVIQGMARVPRGFDRVKSVTFRPGSVVFTSRSGKTARALARWDFLATGAVGSSRQSSR